MLRDGVPPGPGSAPDDVFPLRDPAMAIGMARCVVGHYAKGTRLGVATHPGTCRFCHIPVEQKVTAIEAFLIWSGLDEEGEAIDASLEGFLRLPDASQREAVRVVSRISAEDKRNTSGTQAEGVHTDIDESFTDDEKGPSLEVPAGSPGLGGRAGPGEREGGRLGGSSQAPRTPRGRI